MNREPMQSVDVSDTKYSDSDGDLMVNNLIYEMPKALSLATGRTHVAQFPQRSTYTVDRNSTMVFQWNTGNAYIDTSNSYLRFKMKASGTANVVPASFNYGSALNLFHEYRIRSRSGVELDRLENCNLYNQYRLKYTKSTNWLSTVGQTFFYLSNSAIFNQANTIITDVCIPLCELATFFCSIKKGQLLPPQIASGLQIELSLESVARAFFDANSFFQAGSSLELTDIAMVLDTVSLSDETCKLLNLESSQSGLEWCYNRVYNYSATYAAGTSNFTMQVSKAVSQATHAFMVTQNSVNAQLGTVDSFIADPFAYKSWQMRLGSQYYPNQMVNNQTQTVTVKGMESYLLAMSSFEKMKTPFQETSITPALYSQNTSVIAVSLERNQSLAVSGLPINNSRVLEILVERDATADAGVSRDVNCFLTYVSVAKAFIDNMSVAL
jgi:hypothetical protein